MNTKRADGSLGAGPQQHRRGVVSRMLAFPAVALLASVALVAAPAQARRHHCHFRPEASYAFPDIGAFTTNGVTCATGASVPHGIQRWWSRHLHFARIVTGYRPSGRVYGKFVCHYSQRQGRDDPYEHARCVLRHHPHRWLTIDMGA